MFLITKNWFNLLKDEFEKPYYKDLENFLEREYNAKTIYPNAENVFNALNRVKYEDVKVVIIGQDPYHEPNQAHGLCFSVQKGVKIPPSLVNIYKEIHEEIGCYIPNHGDLTKWANQGVLLLNSVLTVEKGRAYSHRDKGWETFTSKIIELLNNREKPIIFVLWGNGAKKVGEKIDKTKHYVLSSAHPSPLSCYNGFYGNGHFKKINEILTDLNEKPIDWQIENV